MDAMHEAGIKAFVAGVKTAGLGNQPLQPLLENGVKIFELTCKQIDWEYDAGKQVEGLGVQRPGARPRAACERGRHRARDRQERAG